MIRSCARGISLTDGGALSKGSQLFIPASNPQVCLSSHADTITVGRIVQRAKPEKGKPELRLIHMFFESCSILDGNAS